MENKIYNEKRQKNLHGYTRGIRDKLDVRVYYYLVSTSKGVPQNMQVPNPLQRVEGGQRCKHLRAKFQEAWSTGLNLILPFICAFPKCLTSTLAMSSLSSITYMLAKDVNIFHQHLSNQKVNFKFKSVVQFFKGQQSWQKILRASLGVACLCPQVAICKGRQDITITSCTNQDLT